ncbi:hypothetical protein [Enterococcus hirae]
MLNNHSWEEKGKKVYSAETLPEGWNWHVFPDYKACLQDPEGKTYYEIDGMIDDSYIHFTSYEGYLYGADSFVEAQREIEKLVSELLQKEQEEKINHSEDKNICPAEKLPEGWKWHISTMEVVIWNHQKAIITVDLKCKCMELNIKIFIRMTGIGQINLSKFFNLQ